MLLQKTLTSKKSLTLSHPKKHESEHSDRLDFSVWVNFCSKYTHFLTISFFTFSYEWREPIEGWYHSNTATGDTHCRNATRGFSVAGPTVWNSLGWAGTRKVKPICILLMHVTVNVSGISWAICKSAPRPRQITTPVPHHSVFNRPDALPAAQSIASKQ